MDFNAATATLLDNQDCYGKITHSRMMMAIGPSYFQPQVNKWQSDIMKDFVDSKSITLPSGLMSSPVKKFVANSKGNTKAAST